MVSNRLLSVTCNCLLLLSLPASHAGQVTPQVLVANYALNRVSDAVPTSRLAQLAFDPGDPSHLFAVQSDGQIHRYDYAASTGLLSNHLVVASGLGQALGLAFHQGDLYVSLDLGDSLLEPPGDGRLTRLSDPDASGVYQTRHDFVHSIPKGNHDVNHIQIVEHTLYVGIGGVGRKGDPTEENIYSMTIARIPDLTQIDWSGPIDVDFKGPVNYLADPASWTDTVAIDGKLRYYASGFRNPFGIAIDADGDLWASSLGNSDAGFLSKDYLYRKVPLGAQGVFPPSSFGFGPPHITGVPVAPLSDLGQNPSPAGFDFVPGGPDQGKVVLTQIGASNQASFPVGKDVLLVDPVTGAFEILLDDMDQPIDVVQDPLGRLLIADYGDDSVWLLTPPPAESVPGSVPDGHDPPGPPLRLDRSGANLLFSWGPSCAAGDSDYEIYSGSIGGYYDHAWVVCTTGGLLTATVTIPNESAYYVVVPADDSSEGSYGHDSLGTERPQGSLVCLPQVPSPSCP